MKEGERNVAVLSVMTGIGVFGLVLGAGRETLLQTLGWGLGAGALAVVALLVVLILARSA
jgi:hypothetical protein